MQEKNLPATTIDKFLGGKFEVLQPEKGRHRSGLDAVLLAAAVPSDSKGVLVDLGSGVGVAGLAAISRIQELTATLVDCDPIMCALARESLKLPMNFQLAERVTVIEADVTAKGRERQKAGLMGNSANHVVMNPPFYDCDRVSSSPESQRSQAHILAKGGIEPWIRTASDILIGNGTLTVIFQAGGMSELLDAMKGRFGSIIIVPVVPRVGMAATRLIVQGIRGSRTPTEVRRGIVLHEQSGGNFLPEALAVQRDGSGLDLKSL